MTNFWSGWIIVLTITCLVFIAWVLISNWKVQRKELTNETVGHNFDGIEELDNPMPKWWLVLFVITLVFTAGYLVLYPGLGKWDGALNWTAVGQLNRETAKHNRQYEPIFKQYANKSVEELQSNPKALRMGQQLFLNNCALCHGSDAKGAFGFPNLTEGAWLWGGTAEAIKTTLLNGRKGQMPAWGSVIGESAVANVAAYTRELAGIDTGFTQLDLEKGQKVFKTTCSVCHGAEGKGNISLGAPNLTDNYWLYGSSQVHVMYAVRNGRNGVMPAWKHILGEDKVHLLSAYVYSISRNKY